MAGRYRTDFPAWADWKAASGTVSRSTSGGPGGGAQTTNTGGAVNDYVEYEVAGMEAGTYTLTLIYVRNTSSPILTAAVNGGNLSPTVDAYNGSTLLNRVATWTGVTLTEDVNTLRFTATSKNASSTGYDFRLQWVGLERTGA